MPKRAAEQVERDEMADQQMIEEHRRTWRGFAKLMTYSTAAAAIVLLLMAIFLT